MGSRVSASTSTRLTGAGHKSGTLHHALLPGLFTLKALGVPVDKEVDTGPRQELVQLNVPVVASGAHMVHKCPPLGRTSSPGRNCPPCPPLRSFVLPMSSPDLKSHCPLVPFFLKEKSEKGQFWEENIDNVQNWKIIG